MAESKEARNKALVLKAFDTLFNKRDHAAAERLWSPNYIQHSAHIEPGREAKTANETLIHEPVVGSCFRKGAKICDPKRP